MDKVGFHLEAQFKAAHRTNWQSKPMCNWTAAGFIRGSRLECSSDRTQAPLPLYFLTRHLWNLLFFTEAKKLIASGNRDQLKASHDVCMMNEGESSHFPLTLVQLTKTISDR